MLVCRAVDIVFVGVWLAGVFTGGVVGLAGFLDFAAGRSVGV